MLGKNKTFIILATACIIVVLYYFFLNLHHENLHFILGENDNTVYTPGQIDGYMTLSNTITYFNYFISRKTYNFPWTVKIAFGVICASIICMSALVINILSFTYKLHIHAYGMERFVKRRGRLINMIIHSQHNYTYEELINFVKLKNGLPKRYKIKHFYQNQVWFDIWIKDVYNSDEYFNQNNWSQLARIIGIDSYIEKLLTEGNNTERVQELTMLTFMRAPVNVSMVARLLNHKSPQVRKAARLFYMTISHDDPFRFTTEHDRHMSHWDYMLTMRVLEDSYKAGAQMPNFMPMVKNVQDPDGKSFLIEATGFLGTEDEVHELISYINSPDSTIRWSAFRCMAIRKYKPAESALIKAFTAETGKGRRLILKVLRIIHSGETEWFFEKAFHEAPAMRTKLVALDCLWTYSSKGREIFWKLHSGATKQQELLFKHVEHNKNIYLEDIGIQASILINKSKSHGGYFPHSAPNIYRQPEADNF